MSTLKELVAGGKKVTFSHYRQNELWYKTDCGFEFPVPIADTGDATFLATDKAMLFMRYIRKHLECIKLEQATVYCPGCGSTNLCICVHAEQRRTGE